jgi:hypothetical protein
MRNIIILISPFLELGIELCVMSVTDRFVDPMEVLHVALVQIGWGDICPTTEPPHPTCSLKVAIIEMHSGAVRILWMDD